MITEDVSQNWFSIQQIVKNDFLTYITKPEVIMLVKILDLDIQGFSKKKVKNAPLPILKQGLSKFLDNTTDLHKFFKSFTTKHIYDEMKEYEYHTFILNAALHEHLTCTEKFILFAILFPEKYEQEREQIFNNIKKNEDVFHGFIDSSLPEILKVHVDKYEDDLTNLLEEFFEQQPTLDGNDLTEEVDINDFFTKDFDDLDKGIVLQLLKDYHMDGFQLTDQELLYIYQLALNESLHLSITQLKTANDLLAKTVKEKANFETKMNQYIKRRSELLNEVTEKDKEIKRIKEKYQQEINVLKKQHSLLKDKMHEVSNLHVQKQEEKKDLMITFFSEQDQFIFITTKKQDLYKKMIPTNMISYYDQSINFSDQFKFIPKNKLIFIDANHLSSKEQIKIQYYVNFKRMNYKFVSGTPEKMLRQIIFYLEGDILYETRN